MRRNDESMPITVRVQLKEGDIPALLCALPLVRYLKTDFQFQDELNFACCEMATSKLNSMPGGGEVTFSIGEAGLIADIIDLAIEVISGNCPEVAFEIGAKWKQELSGHFFSLNRLRQNPMELE